jgi:hypothetical protein
MYVFRPKQSDHEEWEREFWSRIQVDNVTPEEICKTANELMSTRLRWRDGLVREKLMVRIVNGLLGAFGFCLFLLLLHSAGAIELPPPAIVRISDSVLGAIGGLIMVPVIDLFRGARK